VKPLFGIFTHVTYREILYCEGQYALVTSDERNFKCLIDFSLTLFRHNLYDDFFKLDCMRRMSL